MTRTEESTDPAFDAWVYRAVDTRPDAPQIMGKPAPLLTALLFQVCLENQERFEIACNMLREAFEAGQRDGRADEFVKRAR